MILWKDYDQNEFFVVQCTYLTYLPIRKEMKDSVEAVN